MSESDKKKDTYEMDRDSTVEREHLPLFGVGPIINVGQIFSL